MNPQSPGHDSVDDDIEMIRLQDLHGFDGQNSTKAHLGPREWEDEGDHDDGRRALLASQDNEADDDDDEEHYVPQQKIWPQVKNIVIESAPTLLFTTVGLLFTGEMLDKVSRWQAMKEVHQIIMIIPVIMNLKGNLEMNLSARLGTAANVGELDDKPIRRKLIMGNLSLLQVQAAVVSFIASVIALTIGMLLPRVAPTPPMDISTPVNETVRAVLSARSVTRPIKPPKEAYGTFTFWKLVMVSSTAMTSAALSSIVLGSFMCTLIVLCRQYGRDPDNIAPPIASFLGDLVTLTFLGIVSSILIVVAHTPFPLIVCCVVIGTAFFCLIYTIRNPLVRPLLTQGWSPLFIAMAISSGTGVVLDRFVSRYEGFALLAVVISGLPGSVGSIFVSRLSTALHANALAVTPHSNLHTARGEKGPPEPSERLVMLTLLLITLPVEIIFLVVLNLLGWLKLPLLFVLMSIVFFFIAVLISLQIARRFTNFLWERGLDPDMYALPIHSALMDLIGQGLLVTCFAIFHSVT